MRYVYILILSIGFIFQMSAYNLFAQTLVRQYSIKGFWEGKIVSIINGKIKETPVQIEFEDKLNVTVFMQTPQKAKYKFYQDDTMIITFDNELYEPLILTDINIYRVGDGSMILGSSGITASVNFLSTIGKETDKLYLRRALQSSETKLVPKICESAKLPPSLQEVFINHQIQCPVNIEKNLQSFNADFFLMFLEELFKKTYAELSKSNALPASKNEFLVRVLKSGSKIFIDFSDNDIGSEIIKYLAPIFIDGYKLYIGKDRESDHFRGFYAYSYIFRAGLILPTLKNGSKINYESVWSEVINAASSQGISLDMKTVEKDNNERTIKQKSPRKTEGDDKYIYFENVTVTMREIDDGDQVWIDIKSEVIKRKGFSSMLRKVECVINNTDTDTYVCAEKPYMTAIYKSLTGRNLK